jgi:PAS domain S-box-containing protein
MKGITRHITQAAAVITILIAMLILGSWIFTAKDSTIPGLVKFNTGACLLLASIALLFLNREKTNRTTALIATICSLIVLLTGSLTLAEYIFSTDLGIDQLLWKETNPSPATLHPGRMASLTATLFILLSVSLLLVRKKKLHSLIQVILITGFVILSIFFLYYLTQTDNERFSVLRPVSLHTSFTLLILYIGAFFSYPLRYLRFSIQKRMAAFFSYAVLLLLIVFFAERQNTRRFSDTARLVDHTNIALLQNLEVKSLAQEIESSTRSFVISANDEQLVIFDKAVSQIHQAVQRLRETTKDNPRQQQRIDSLDQLVSTNIELRQQVIRIRRTEGFAGVEQFSPTGARKNKMNELQSLITAIESEEKQLLAKRKLENELSINDSSRVIVLFQLITALLLLGAFLVIYYNIRLRNKAEKEIKSLNENLEKKVEEKTNELLKNELHFRHILDNLLEGAQILGFDWKYRYVNDAFLKHSKYSREELVGHTVMEKYPGIEKAPIYRVYKKCFEERVAVHLENEFVFPDGSMGWFELSFQPVPEGIFILSVDITPRKQAELLLKELNEALGRRAAELQSSNTELERFAYVASHDLQEPLRMVSSFLHLLERKMEGRLDEAGRQYIGFAVDGAERMKKLIQDLLEYSRVGTSKESMTEVDCNEVMNTVRSMLSLSITEIKASVFVKKLPVIRAVQPQMIQLFQNLVGNALKYHGETLLVVEIGCIEKGPMWEFYVKDNGIGIDPKFFEKIFIIFQRLHNKTDYAGTGIGLSICKKIVEKHGGAIRVESEPGNGSTFYFTLPKK